MTYSTTVGVNLAKNIIQVSVVSGGGKELLNRSLTRKKFMEFLVRQKSSLIAFESCATAHSYTYRLKEPKSAKDRWLKDHIERNGHSRTAIALANKNVRTAWAMVTQDQEYQRREQLEMAA